MKKITTLLFSLFICMYSFGVCTFTITTASLPSGNNFHPYTKQLATENGVGSTVWSVSSGSLPTGLSINTANGVITGAVGSFLNTTYTFTIAAINSGCTAVKTFSVSFTNLQVSNIDYVGFATNVNGAQQAPFYSNYDMVRNAYNLPIVVGNSPITVGYATTWYGNAPTYSVSCTSCLTTSNYTAVVGYGTYTPTVTEVSNITSITGLGAQWSKVGNVVTVSGELSVGVSTLPTVNFVVDISLPVTSTFIAESNCAGTGSYYNASTPFPSHNTFIQPFTIKAEIGGTKARFISQDGNSTGTFKLFFTFIYLVL